MSRISTWVVTIVAALVVTAAACGSEDGTPKGRTGDGTVTTPFAGVQGSVVSQPVSTTTVAAPAVDTATAARGGTTAVATGATQAATQPADNRTAADPCRLVTAEETRVALGAAQPLAAKRTTSVADDPQCVYGDLATTGHVVVVIPATDPGSSARADLEVRRRALDGEEVRGVGDAAFVSTALRSIEAVAGGTRFLISLSLSTPNMSPAEARTALMELSKAAAGRLR